MKDREHPSICTARLLQSSTISKRCINNTECDTFNSGDMPGWAGHEKTTWPRPSFAPCEFDARTTSQPTRPSPTPSIDHKGYAAPQGQSRCACLPCNTNPKSTLSRPQASCTQSSRSPPPPTDGLGYLQTAGGQASPKDIPSIDV